ncbi:retroviral-like aspartic protease [Candidatus Microgenomates bacterium]|nr:retroviral-like aspartic protease [Candidatus Microgenomates bacterium]
MHKIVSPVFPYESDSLGNTFPIIPLALAFTGKKKEFYALVDSGATISVFRAEVADSLGLVIEKGKEMYLGGVGGRIKGYLHEVEIEIAGINFLCPIVFSREYLVSFNLLGREAFFPRYRIIFEEKKKQLHLEVGRQG